MNEYYISKDHFKIRFCLGAGIPCNSGVQVRFAAGCPKRSSVFSTCCHTRYHTVHIAVLLEQGGYPNLRPQAEAHLATLLKARRRIPGYHRGVCWDSCTSATEFTHTSRTTNNRQRRPFCHSMCGKVAQKTTKPSAGYGQRHPQFWRVFSVPGPFFNLLHYR